VSDHGTFGTLPRAQAGDRPDVIALSPCPFCESEEVSLFRDGSYYAGPEWIECLACGGRGGRRETGAEAISAWERRA